jgi:hypothetical protein
MEELGAGAEDALARMRGHAFAAGKPISEVAHEIVAGRLRLEKDAAWAPARPCTTSAPLRPAGMRCQIGGIERATPDLGQEAAPESL